MAGSLNRVCLIGNLGADPEIKHLNDRKICNMRIATSESWTDKSSGERKERTEWHTVVIYSDGLAKVAEQFLQKGSKVYVEGQLQTRKWQDKDGNDRYSTEVVLNQFNSTMILLSGGERKGEAGPNPDAVQRNMDAQAPLDSDLSDSIPW